MNRRLRWLAPRMMSFLGGCVLAAAMTIGKPIGYILAVPISLYLLKLGWSTWIQ